MLIDVSSRMLLERCLTFFSGKSCQIAKALREDIHKAFLESDIEEAGGETIECQHCGKVQPWLGSHCQHCYESMEEED